MSAGHPGLTLGISSASSYAYGVLVTLVVEAAEFLVSAFASALVQPLFSYGVAWFLLFGGCGRWLSWRGRGGGPCRRWRGGMSDADQLARLTGVPGGVWVGVFAVVALCRSSSGARLRTADGARATTLILDECISIVTQNAQLWIPGS